LSYAFVERYKQGPALVEEDEEATPRELLLLSEGSPPSGTTRHLLASAVSKHQVRFSVF
jgi:hypothetical protein